MKKRIGKIIWIVWAVAITITQLLLCLQCSSVSPKVQLMRYVVPGNSIEYATRFVGEPLRITEIKDRKTMVPPPPPDAVFVVEYPTIYGAKCHAYLNADRVILSVFWYDT
jgi:hypothetical protein